MKIGHKNDQLGNDMPFGDNKNKHDEQGHFWASYSDLLLGMSVVFLLLYVTASLRSGTNGIQQQIENQKMGQQIQDLKNQLKAYEAIKQDYLAKDANKDEQQQYVELMDKLTLLQDEAKNEKENLKNQMVDQEKKEKALNQYQQLVRNIINANTLAKTKIDKRNTVIQTQDTEILAQNENIKNLNLQILNNQSEIEKTKAELSQNSNELFKSLKAQKITKAAYEQQIAQLKFASDEKVKGLEQKEVSYKQQLALVEQKANQLGNDLLKANSALGDKEAQIASMKKGFAEQAAKDRAEFEVQLSKERLGAAEIAKREAGYRTQLKAKEDDLNRKIASLSGELSNAQGTIGKLQAEVEARKKVADEIKKAFAAKGIKAEVDGQTGDVVLDFGEHYFLNDSAKLNSGMTQVLEKAMPTYAQSLLGNPKIADKVTSVEIVGFASPTYKGKFIDPKSEVQKDKEALAYNMDLSYKRAKSIYEYSFHNDKVNFPYQKKMLPMVKVSARSFLEVFDTKRQPANFEKYCKENDCNKARRVMIKFTMDGQK